MIKLLLALSSTLLLFFFGLFGFSESLQSKQNAMHEVLTKTANQLKKKYGLNQIGIGESSNSDGMLTTIGLELQMQHRLNVHDAREIIIESVIILLENINNDKHLRAYLANFPFSQNNVEINIYISEQNYKKIFHPDIVSISFDFGKITYRTLDPENEYSFKSRIEESYEEALHKLEEEN